MAFSTSSGAVRQAVRTANHGGMGELSPDHCSVWLDTSLGEPVKQQEIRGTGDRSLAYVSLPSDPRFHRRRRGQSCMPSLPASHSSLPQFLKGSVGPAAHSRSWGWSRSLGLRVLEPLRNMLAGPVLITSGAGVGFSLIWQSLCSSPSDYSILQQRGSGRKPILTASGLCRALGALASAFRAVPLPVSAPPLGCTVLQRSSSVEYSYSAIFSSPVYSTLGLTI
ncbi:hypothetical protein NDU88_006748 [Pleurodeles waltl]|uniref:Uncharacterized protein n=1 Tax=Pleurodeles waltl TaxID=8319 RepID=A0AAV7PKJ9_PLEWA|nr:hypothetical protein NDU88_006748 [Pleurodeles waltl]